MSHSAVTDVRIDENGTVWEMREGETEWRDSGFRSKNYHKLPENGKIRLWLSSLDVDVPYPYESVRDNSGRLLAVRRTIGWEKYTAYPSPLQTGGFMFELEVMGS
jgi:hypothetical protein